MECKSLRESDSELAALDVAHFMISVDDVETNTKFAQQNGARFPILSDPTKAAARAYGVLAWHGYASRWTYYIGNDGRILFIDRDVKSLSAGEDVVRKLHELNVVKRAGNQDLHPREGSQQIE